MQKLLGCILCSFLLIGCGQSKEQDNTLTMWHWMTDRNEVFQVLIDQYEQETGVKIKLDLYAPSDVFIKKITASAQAKALPDIYGMIDKKQVFASYIKNGFIADLTAEFKANDAAWEKTLFEKALNVNKFEEGNSYGVTPGIYGVPLDVTNVQMVYNKKLLKKAGFNTPPQTFDEFLTMVSTLKRIGISGFVSGWGEEWMTDAFASNYAFNIMGRDKVMATIRGEVPYTDPDWIAVFNVFKQMRDNDVLIEGIVTKGNKFAEQDFALERAAFAFNGSWCVNVYGQMNPALEYAPMIPPKINSNHPMNIWGGAGSSFVVNGQSAHKQKAISFLKWLTVKEQQIYFAEETQNLPANRNALADIPEVLSEFAKGMEVSTHPTIWSVNESPLVTEKFNRGIQSILIGDKTPEQVAQELQNFKEKLMTRTRK